MVGLTYNERFLLHKLRVEKNWGSEKNMEMFSNKWAHLNWEYRPLINNQVLNLFKQHKYPVFWSLYGIILT